MAEGFQPDVKRHFSAWIVAVEIFPQMLREMIGKWQPSFVAMMIKNDPEFEKSLDMTEKKLIKTLETDGFNKLDITLLYKLIRFCKLLIKPTKKWGIIPDSKHVNQGDDLERMRSLRNDIFHRPKGGISEGEVDKFFHESIGIARRLDIAMGNPEKIYENKIKTFKDYAIQEPCSQAHLDLFNNIEFPKQGKDGVSGVNLYFGSDIEVKFGQQESDGSISTRCTMYVRNLPENIDVSALVQKLDELKNVLNEGSYDIKLLKPERGSLILHVQINNTCFASRDSLYEAVDLFLKRSLVIETVEQQMIEVVLAEYVDIYFSESEEDNEYLCDQTDSVLKLDVTIQRTAFQSKENLYRDVSGFVKNIVTVGTESTNGQPLDIIMTVNESCEDGVTYTSGSLKKDPEYHKVEMTNEFCGICQAPFSSVGNAEAHYTGKTHKKALAKKESGMDNFLCDLCGVPCSGPGDFQKHKNGKLHRKKELESEGSTVFKEVDESLTCKICKITCTCPENLQAHLAGKSHNKKVQQLEVFAKSSKDDKDFEDPSICVDELSHVDVSEEDNSDHSDTSSEIDDFTIKYDKSFVRNLLDSESETKYTKNFDYKTNLNLNPVQKNEEKEMYIDSFTSEPSTKKENVVTKISNLMIKEVERPNIRFQGGSNISCQESDKKKIEIVENPTIPKILFDHKDLPKVETFILKQEEQIIVKKSSSTPTVRKPKKPQIYHCIICNALMNTEKEYQVHLNGQQHSKKLLAPERPLQPTIWKETDASYIKINTRPRKYQEELFKKAMKGDSICFLPTGTGKTLIGCMVVSAMLEQNPLRQVVFLVDRGLLVLQQCQYLKKELGDILFKRFGLQDLSSLEERKLLIAGLCSGSQSSGGCPLWKHDIIVVTAAYYENLLEKNLLRWTDTCLVVFDEAHHCIKNHPYNRLLYFKHKECPPDQRPKLMGLTASPAGKSTVKQTENMLLELKANLENATIEIVEDNEKELDVYRSNAEMDIQTVSLSIKETKFQHELQVYLLHCYKRLGEMTDLLQYSESDDLKLCKIDEKEINKIVDDNFDGNMLNYLQETIEASSPKPGSTVEQKSLAFNFQKHSKYICVSLNILLQFGMKAAIDELTKLIKHEEEISFEFARKIGLPSRNIDDIISFISCGYTESSGNEGKFYKLIDLLTNTETLSLLDEEKTMVLILVKERGSAFKIEELLQTHVVLKTQDHGVSALVGHGTTSGTEPGMKISHQKVILDKIRDHKYKILVATSIAEEGIDIPECELVITLNPPSNVTALVQMRGRARKSKSRFIVVCNSIKEKEDLEDLMARERNMMEAVKSLAGH